MNRRFFESSTLRISINSILIAIFFIHPLFLFAPQAHANGDLEKAANALGGANATESYLLGELRAAIARVDGMIVDKTERIGVLNGQLAEISKESDDLWKLVHDSPSRQVREESAEKIKMLKAEFDALQAKKIDLVDEVKSHWKAKDEFKGKIGIYQTRVVERVIKSASRMKRFTAFIGGVLRGGSKVLGFTAGVGIAGKVWAGDIGGAVADTAGIVASKNPVGMVLQPGIDIFTDLSVPMQVERYDNLMERCSTPQMPYIPDQDRVDVFRSKESFDNFTTQHYLERFKMVEEIRKIPVPLPGQPIPGLPNEAMLFQAPGKVTLLYSSPGINPGDNGNLKLDRIESCTGRQP